MMTQIIALTTTLCLTSGCATMRDSLILGIGSGAATGAAVGAIATRSGQADAAIIGGLIGAAVGGGIAYYTQKGIENRDEAVRKETIFNLEKFGVSEMPAQSAADVPSISFRVVEEQKVETHRVGNKVYEGHRIWVLSDDSNVLYSGKPVEKKDDPKNEK